MFIVSEALYSFAWQAFWQSKLQDVELLSMLHDLRKLLLSEKREQCVTQFGLVLQATYELKKKIDNFLNKCEAMSELCQYFGQFQVSKI